MLKHKKRKSLEKKGDAQLNKPALHYSPLSMKIRPQSESTNSNTDKCYKREQKSKVKGIKKSKLRQKEM